MRSTHIYHGLMCPPHDHRLHSLQSIHSDNSKDKTCFLWLEPLTYLLHGVFFTGFDQKEKRITNSDNVFILSFIYFHSVDPYKVK